MSQIEACLDNRTETSTLGRTRSSGASCESQILFTPWRTVAASRSNDAAARGKAWGRVGLDGRRRRAWWVGFYIAMIIWDKIKGFDVKRGVWKELKGLDKGLPRFLCGVTMADLGGNLVVVWECQWSGKEMEILCAEIHVKNNPDGELWGQVGWISKVLSVLKAPPLCTVFLFPCDIYDQVTCFY